jgi:hypothetical protein
MTTSTNQHVTEPIVAEPALISPPGGATEVGDWTRNDGTARRFEGTKRGTDVHVDIVGWQDRDGAIERFAFIENDIELRSPAAAQELAANLLATADEMEVLAD